MRSSGEDSITGISTDGNSRVTGAVGAFDFLPGPQLMNIMAAKMPKTNLLISQNYAKKPIFVL